MKPAWDCYASDEMASEPYMLASLGEIGLLHAMMNYAWVNTTVPADKETLARVLGRPLQDVMQHYKGLIDANFQRDPDNASRLFCPELERQKQRIALVRGAQAKAGRDTARKLRERAAEAALNKGKPEERLAGRSPLSSPLAPELNGTERTEGFQGKQEEGLEEDPWIKAAFGEGT